MDFHRSFRICLRANLALSTVILILSLVSCHNSPEPSAVNTLAENPVVQDTGKPLHLVRLLPYWVPSAQFAGYYVGIEKGIFQKHGIDLEIVPFEPLMSTASIIKDKKTDFALLWLVNAIDIRDKGVDIVNIAQLSSRSSLMFITKKSSSISRLEDMNGKRAGIWIGFERQPEALFRKFNLDVKIIPIGSTNNLFLQGGVDILNANWFDEYHSVINNGINEDELNKFYFADYGLNFLEDGIYCLDEMVKNDPGLCAAFMEAALESWNYAFNNQEEAIDIVIKFAMKLNQPVNHSHQKWMLSVYKALYFSPGSTAINTSLDEKDYDAIQQIVLESGFINKVTPYHSFYKPYDKLNKSR